MNVAFSSQQIDTIIKYKRYLRYSRSFQKRALTVLFSSLTITAASWGLFIAFLLVPALKTYAHLQLYSIYVALFLTALSVVVLIGGPIASICIDSYLDKYRNKLPPSVKDSYLESENKIETQQNLEDDEFLTTAEETTYSLSENELESDLDQLLQKIHSICIELLKYDDIILKSIRNPSLFQSILSKYVKFNNLCEKSWSCSRYPVPLAITVLVAYLLAAASNGLRKEFVKYSYEIHEFSAYFVEIFSFCLCVFLVYCPSLENRRKHTLYVVKCFKQLASCFKEVRKLLKNNYRQILPFPIFRKIDSEYSNEFVDFVECSTKLDELTVEEVFKCFVESYSKKHSVSNVTKHYYIYEREFSF